MQRTFGLCQLATSLKKGCGSETNNILTMLISETYYIGTLTSQHIFGERDIYIYEHVLYVYTHIGLMEGRSIGPTFASHLRATCEAIRAIE
jgi:hypothetical protein